MKVALLVMGGLLLRLVQAQGLLADASRASWQQARQMLPVLSDAAG